MKSNSLYDFWRQHVDFGFHPKDTDKIREAGDVVIDWTFAEAKKNKKRFSKEKTLHCKIHKNLFPQPFSGNLNSARVFLLYGNPGFSEEKDYADNYETNNYVNLCKANLRGKLKGLICLNNKLNVKSGLKSYWLKRFKHLADDLVAKRIASNSEEALSKIEQSVAILEAGAYQSRSSPGGWFFDLPSSRKARDFARTELLKRAKQNKCLILVWRKKDFWDLPDSAKNVIFRKNARLSYLEKEEREQICKWIR